MFCSKIRAYTFLQLPPAPYRLAFPMIFHGLGVDIFWSLKLAEKMVYFDMRVVYSLSYVSREPLLIFLDPRIWISSKLYPLKSIKLFTFCSADRET